MCNSEISLANTLKTYNQLSQKLEKMQPEELHKWCLSQFVIGELVTYPVIEIIHNEPIPTNLIEFGAFESTQMLRIKQLRETANPSTTCKAYAYIISCMLVYWNSRPLPEMLKQEVQSSGVLDTIFCHLDNISRHFGIDRYYWHSSELCIKVVNCYIGLVETRGILISTNALGHALYLKKWSVIDGQQGIDTPARKEFFKLLGVGF